jgi:hypothetical protein
MLRLYQVHHCPHLLCALPQLPTALLSLYVYVLPCPAQCPPVLCVSLPCPLPTVLGVALLLLLFVVLPCSCSYFVVLPCPCASYSLCCPPCSCSYSLCCPAQMKDCSYALCCPAPAPMRCTALLQLLCVALPCSCSYVLCCALLPKFLSRIRNSNLGLAD